MDLRDRLNAALVGSYTIDREIGGGGMARVFAAREVALGRAVVVKVLPPELAADMSEERFRREVLLAAGLQHPHIVPILAAGETDGLLYYTMPLVEGEALRARLSREGELPVAEAVRVLTCVADAMAYAHSHGIVHRDIKPENILLSGQHALVTDFGVAKALGSAASGTTLTGTGLALGTAGYMAPEQVAADPGIDHRADIYAFGVVAYELLTGATPFSARTAQQLAAAHLTQRPEHITARRAAVPAALASLVMNCLEKRPADRPQSAEWIAGELATIAISGAQPATHGQTPRKRRAVLVGAGAVALAALVAAFAFYGSKNAGNPVDAKRVVVAILANETGDTTLASFGKMAADWLTQGLQETGFIDVVDSRTVLQASRELSAGNAPVVEAVAAQTGAAIVVWGSYYTELDSLIIRAQIVDAADSRVLRTVSVGRISRQTPTVALEILRERVLGALAPLVDPRLATWETSLKPPSYAAYRAYMEGLESYVAQSGGALSYDSVAAYFEKAVSLDTAFHTARLWQAFNLYLAGWTTNPRFLRPADSVIGVLQQQHSALSTSDQRFLDWFLALRRNDMPAAYMAARAMMDASPGSAHAIWEAALAAVRTNRPREGLQLLERPELAGSEGSLVLQSYWNWKAAALHLLEDYKNELRVARLARERGRVSGDIEIIEARAQAALGNTREALEIAQSFVGASAASAGPSLFQIRIIVEELQAHGHGDAARTLADRGLNAYREHERSTTPNTFARVNAAHVLYAAGRFDELHPAVAELNSLDSAAFPTVAAELSVRGLGGVLAARAGDRAAAQAIASQLESRTLDVAFKPLCTYWRARIAAVLGERDNAVALLRQAFAEGYLPVSAIAGRFLHSDPDLRSLQSMPGFRALLRPRG